MVAEAKVVEPLVGGWCSFEERGLLIGNEELNNAPGDRLEVAQVCFEGVGLGDGNALLCVKVEGSPAYVVNDHELDPRNASSAWRGRLHVQEAEESPYVDAGNAVVVV